MKTRKQKIRQERPEEMQETRQLKVEKREERKQLEVKKEKLKKVKQKKEKLKKEKVRKPKKERIKKERPAKQTERKPQPKKTGNSRKAAKDKGMGLRGIQVKLIGAFMIPVILFVIIGFMIYSKCSTTLNSTYEASANTSVGTLEEYLGLGFENIELMATRLSINSAITSYYTGSEVKSESMLMDTKVALSNESTADKFIDHIIVCAKSGTACSEKGAIRGDVYNAFVESEEGKNVESEIGMGSMWISSHPAIDEVTGYDSDEYALSLVTVLKNNSNKSVGYIIIDVKTSFIQDILDNAQISDNSIKGFVLEDGSQVLSGDSDIKFTDTDFYQEALAGENLQGSKEVSYEGADYLFTYSRIEGTNMLVCAMVPQKEIMAGAQAILRYTLIAVAICAVIAIVVGSVLASGISKAIRKVNRVLKKTSDGDLTGQISMKRKDEFNVLSSSITNMIGSMKDLILKMTNVSGHVSDSAVQVGTNSEVLLEVTKNITEAVDYINSGISQQAQDTESCLEQMNGLAERINVVHENTDEISEIAQEAQGAIENGMVIVANLGEKVQGTTEVTETIIREIRELNKESIAINSIIGTINEIAEQTNLLSLNASIEAARAGEQGKGFGVVASEIQKLAEQTNESATHIEEIVQELLRDAEKAVETMYGVKEIMHTQSDHVEQTESAFEQVQSGVEQSIEGINRISEHTTRLNDAREKVVGIVQNLTSIAEANAAGTEQTSASATEVGAIMEDISGKSTAMRQAAQELDDGMNIFKL